MSNANVYLKDKEEPPKVIHVVYATETLFLLLYSCATLIYPSKFFDHIHRIKIFLPKGQTVIISNLMLSKKKHKKVNVPDNKIFLLKKI